MKFLLDESADFLLAAHLRGLGHDVKTVAHDYSRALRDREVLEIAQKEARILITNDRDFGELIFRQRLPHAGVILFRLGNEALHLKVTWLEYVLREHPAELTEFIVIADRGVRIRRTGGH